MKKAFKKCSKGKEGTNNLIKKIKEGQMLL